ncbi:response regulator [Panacibacter ginsenosidivorans]|uniref:Response regulator n=1 Tax=Panacibacter ginsenosidivorans TaxID=1813871 RepID=A0A5B8VAC7_9BACT|nr:response regulator [Panacibacter ginsenosidivorans]QEC67821.1 response regulator [Panacibacter ginsenosidivorans]
MNDSKPQVLLIDDDQVYLFAATKTIEATGLAGTVDVCTNGLDALEYLNRIISSSGKLPDVIFIDINMPVMDGWEFLEEYKTLSTRINDNIKIYILSSSVDKNDIMRSKEYNSVIEYVVKPVYKEKFSEILQSAIS